MPGLHLLPPHESGVIRSELRVVAFSQVHSLPLEFERAHAEQSGPRLRLLPPYREHVAQGFARFFMRVGLPIDIPPIR